MVFFLGRLDIDHPERTTEEYEGPDMASRVHTILATPLSAEEEELLNSAIEIGITNPYQQYAADDNASVAGGKDRARSSNKSRSGRPKSSSRSRPKSAVRKRDDDTVVEG